MIIFTIGTIILTVFLIYLKRSINKVLQINSIITIISGYLVILVSLIINITIKRNISFMNTNTITNAISSSGINRGLILILFGAIQLIIHTIINIYNNRYTLKKNKKKD